MSPNTLAPLLSCLRRAADAAHHGQVTDRDLLQHYLAGRDPSAFSALLQRHGPRVFATCRSILHHDADVEDAFQATFLVLLNKAGSIRWEASLGNWLATVAHRVSVRTRGQRAKLGRRETQADLPEAAERGDGDNLLWREACAILHEELDRLPDQLRVPLLLCYIEGLPRDEAAQSLGCTLDTIKGRLERGRARLRQRLERRGLSLSAGLLGALVGSTFCVSAGSATAAPPQLMQATLQAAAGQASARVALLAYGGSYLMKNKLKMLAATLLTIGLISGAGMWLLGPAPPQGQLGERGSGEARCATERSALPAPHSELERADPAREEKDTVKVSGRVLTPDGKVCPGARLFTMKVKKRNPRSEDDVGVEQVGTTGDDGRFSVLVPFPPELQRDYLVAHAEGYGVDFLELNGKAPADDVTLKLVKDQPITGRVVDTEGKAVAGVKVGAGSIYVPRGDKLDDYLTGWKTDWRDTVGTPEKRLYLPLDGITGAATTDKDGRFKLTGAGVERIIHLSIHGGGLARATPHVITRADFDPKSYNDAALNHEPPELRIKGQTPVLYGPDFTYVAEFSKVVEGVVKDVVTGKPLADVSVHALFGFGDGVDGKTDKDGKYRLEGLPPNKEYSVYANPPAGSTYLRRHGSAPDAPGNKPIRIDIELARGIVVTGRVTDKQTGKGVAAGIRFAPLPKNEYIDKPGYDFYKRDHTMATVKDDGTFRVVTIPGPQLLMIQVHAREKVNGAEVCPYMRAVPDPDYKDLFQYDKDDDEWRFTAAGGSLEFLGIENVVKVIDLKEDGGESKVELSVERGKTATIALQDTDGKPLTGVVASGITAHWPITFKLSEATATVFALDPEKPRRLVFLHPEKKLGGTAVVRGDEKEPVVVKLAPLGTVTGRFVDTDGAPLAGATLRVSCPDRIASELYRQLELTAPVVKTDKDGRFTLPDVVAGVKFYVQTNKGNTYYVGEPRIGLKEVEAGKTLDLGERKLKPQ